ncbi:MAG: low temperature requirement protein A [Eggerthellaceae bacterium]|jgi:low temperature requirement protein LtrA
MEHKKVEIVELFFDLVLVYAVSKTTGVIHELNAAGQVDPAAYVTFVVAFVIVMNAWMYQAVFTNRYGANSPKDMLISFVNMAILLYLSNTITPDWQSTFVPFTTALGLIFAFQFLQYLLAYRKDQLADERFFIRWYLLLTGVYAAALLIGAQLPYETGIWFSLGGLAVNLLLPAIFHRHLNAIPLNWGHLVERLTLFVIITFGEMVVGLAAYFTVGTLSASSLIVFATAVALFVYYILQFDYMLDESHPNLSTALVQYAHIPIVLGLGMTTVSFSFMLEAGVDHFFLVTFLYAGLALFFGGVYLCHGYNEPRFKSNAATVGAQVAIFVAAFAICLAFGTSSLAVSAITAVACIALSCVLGQFYLSHKDAELEGGELQK